MAYPRMFRVRQQFDAPKLDDIPTTIRKEMAKLSLAEKVKPGQSIAITVGSRGIANIALIVKTVAEELKAIGGKPFVVPAMGSHGGGTAEGQKAIVENYGVTEEYTGAPVKSSMEVVKVGEIEHGVPVYFDKNAYEADHVIVAGRVKPHTDFAGEIESGLHKMMLIGLGKHEGAKVYHQAIAQFSFDHIIRAIGKTVIEKCDILMGLAILENPSDETALIEAVPPDQFATREPELLVKAKEWIQRLPTKYVDVLIVDEIGKNISGTGLDTNVVGRKFNNHVAMKDEFPKIKRIYLRDLTEITHGNATGIGISEFAHKKLVDKINYEITYINCITGSHPTAAGVPIHFDSDKRNLEEALKTVGYVKPENARVIRIHNTLELGEILVSEVYLDELKGVEGVTIVEEPKDMEFDENGDLLPF